MLDKEVHPREAHCAPVCVTLPAQIDLTSAERAYDQLSVAVASAATVVIADFTATAFCDCSSLHRLVTIGRRAAARDAELRLVIPPGSAVRRIAQLMDLGHLLPVYSSPREAMEASLPASAIALTTI